MTKKIACFITNTAFGKSEEDDKETIKRINAINLICNEKKCHDLIICGGLLGLNRNEYDNKDSVLRTLVFIKKNLPRNLMINYSILSGYQEEYILRKHGISPVTALSNARQDITDLGYNQVSNDETLIYVKKGPRTTVGFNNGEPMIVNNLFYNPAALIDNITNGFNGNLVIIGGKNKYEEFIYNSRLVVALPSIVNPIPSYKNENKSPDLGYVFIERENDSINIEEHVKRLSKTPDFLQ